MTVPNEAAERLRDWIDPVPVAALGGQSERGLLDAALATERRLTVEEMEREGVVTWGDDRHRERFFLDELGEQR